MYPFTEFGFDYFHRNDLEKKKISVEDVWRLTRRRFIRKRTSCDADCVSPYTNSIRINRSVKFVISTKEFYRRIRCNFHGDGCVIPFDFATGVFTWRHRCFFFFVIPNLWTQSLFTDCIPVNTIVYINILYVCKSHILGSRLWKNPLI